MPLNLNDEGRMTGPLVRARIKQAVRALIKANGGEEACALVTRAHRSLIGRYGRPQEDLHMPADVIGDLEVAVDGTDAVPLVTRELAALTGHVLVRLPDAEAAEPSLKVCAAMAKKSGEALASLAEALEDGTVTRKERACIRQDLTELLEVAAGVMRRVDGA